MPVPLNTLIKRPSSDELRPSKDIIWELTRDGEMFIAARGGAGGHGNAFYLSNMVRKPLKAEEGGSGEKVCEHLYSCQKQHSVLDQLRH